MDAGEGKLGLPSVSLESEETELSKTRYQQGSVRRVARQQGPDVWIFRWRNTHADGSRKENNRVIGTVGVEKVGVAFGHCGLEPGILT